MSEPVTDDQANAMVAAAVRNGRPVEIHLLEADRGYHVTIGRAAGFTIYSECCASQVSRQEAGRIYAALGALLEIEDAKQAEAGS